MATEKYVTGGMNILKCKSCDRNDIKGVAFIPITLDMLAAFRANDGGVIKGTCLNGHAVMFIVKTRPMSMTNQHAQEMLQHHQVRETVAQGILGD
jgi:hypothetical protein